jgi:hypothetical protein
MKQLAMVGNGRLGHPEKFTIWKTRKAKLASWRIRLCHAGPAQSRFEKK